MSAMTIKADAGALAPVFELPSARDARLVRLKAEACTAMEDLLPAEQGFVRYICSAMRPGEAAVRAGYQKSTGYQLIKNPRIQRAISIVNEWADLEAGVDPAWVRKKLRDVVELAHKRRELKTEIGALRLLSELAGLVQGKAPAPAPKADTSVNIQINFGQGPVSESDPDGTGRGTSGPQAAAHTVEIGGRVVEVGGVPATPAGEASLGDLLA